MIGVAEQEWLVAEGVAAGDGALKGAGEEEGRDEDGLSDEANEGAEILRH